MPKLFDTVYQWYKNLLAHEDYPVSGKTLLVRDLEDDQPKFQSFCIQLIEGKYYDLAKLAEEMVIKEVPEKWEWIKTTRFKIGICEEDQEDERES